MMTMSLNLTVPHYRQNLDMVCAGEGVRAQSSLIYSQQATNHCCRHYPELEFKDFSVSSGHPITVIYSKSCQAMLFWLKYKFGCIVNHQSTIMLFCINITLFLTHLHINYYSAEHHENCNVITKCAKNAHTHTHAHANRWTPWKIRTHTPLSRPSALGTTHHGKEDPSPDTCPTVHKHCAPPQQPGPSSHLRCKLQQSLDLQSAVGNPCSTSLWWLVCLSCVLYGWNPLQTQYNSCLKWFVPCVLGYYFWKQLYNGNTVTARWDGGKPKPGTNSIRGTKS